MLCFLHSELVRRPVNTVHNITFQSIVPLEVARREIRKLLSFSFPGVRYRGGIFKNVI